MKLTKQFDNDTVSIKITESATVRQVGEIYGRLIEAAKDSPAKIRMDLCEVSECDISFIQLLISFKKLLDQKEVFLQFTQLDAGSPFVSCMQMCGMHPHYLFDVEEVKNGF